MIGDEAAQLSDEPTISPPPDKAKDRFSAWSIILVVVLVSLQLLFNDGQSLVKTGNPERRASASDTISTDQFQTLITVDEEVKQAYALTALPPAIAAEIAATKVKKSVSGETVLGTSGISASNSVQLSPFHQEIQDALNQSVSALRDTPDATYFARRVILLRLILDQPPFDPIPSAKKKQGLSSPLDSWKIAASEDPEAASLVEKEANFYKDTFGDETTSRANLPGRLKELNDHPTLLFYSLIARQQIFLRAGSYAEAKRSFAAMQKRAIISLAESGCLSLALVSFILVGGCVLVGSIASATRRKRMAKPGIVQLRGAPDIFSRFVVPVAPVIENADRKLRAGDLFECFAIYLLSLTGLGTVLALLSGLLPKSAISHLSLLQLTYVEIGFALITYVGSSGVAFAFLKVKANKKGASLGTELGLSVHNLRKQLIYGAIGWGASLVLIFGVGLVLQSLLHSLPAPSNPALPMLSFAPDTVARLALYALVAVAAPFFEETFFRGVLLNSLLLRFKPVWACLIVGLMFGGIHPVGLVEAGSLSALGFVFAWMAYIRKSLAPSMFAHFMQNSFAYVTVYLCFSTIYRFQ